MGELVAANSEEERMEVVVVEEEEEERENGAEEVRWEMYLPSMVIRVLLVEADYSTRQIIAALLRKCNYEVAAISDGLKAWEILKRGHNNIHLVLTELNLPSISGYALLTLAMEHESCKNIPVIMMSSHDSISMVFKCLLKGAADFLIKPVRRNELKNLWQHVWKRLPQINVKHVSHNMSTGHCKLEAALENNAATSHTSDIVPPSWRNSKSSDKASEAQSSCTTRYVEAESAYLENVSEVSQPKHGRESDLSEAEMGQCENVVKSSIRMEEDGSYTERMTEDESAEPERHGVMANIDSNQLLKPPREAIDLIGRIDDHQKCTIVQSSSSNERNWIDFSPVLDLSLRLRDLQNQELDERHKQNHYNASAFSGSAISSKEKNIQHNVVGESAHPAAAFLNPQHGPVPDLGVSLGSISDGYCPVFLPIFGPESGGQVSSSPKSAHQQEPSPSSLHSVLGTDSSSLGCCWSDEATNQSAGGNVPENSKFISMAKLDAMNTQPAVCQSATSEGGKDDGTDNVMHDQFGRTSSHRTAQREAALRKFLLKRKERCYEKKVRYQSRKILAQQRPRVKGQFVRQAHLDQPIADANNSSHEKHA
ncbi:hypothetical protein Nepgr_023613 [Nepenthes gracilis]|uniref:Uncharacterized protein n=1 Tax=Nepenthes gracilis TaxID=150966 RepID=A0AAD3T4K2_NEPGR|nr:hypothetical protein Nepgr_023613 [Nepenthes gracilis]